MDNIKRITPYFSEKARGAGYVSMIEYDLYEIERIFRECDEALAEAGMPGLDYISQAGEIDEMLDNLSTLLAYAENAHSYVSDNLDFPLYTDFKNHATESLSHIVMDDIYTENTIGMEEHTEVNVEGTLYVGKQVKPHLRFSDFLGIVEIEPKDGYPVLENIETVGEFASLFRADYDKMKPTVEINKFLEGYLVTGEFEHVGYHPVRDFLSGLADLTIVIPILDCILGKDIITGEDLSDFEIGMKLAGVVIDIFTLGQAMILSEATEKGVKLLGRIIATEMLANTAGYTAGYIGNKMGLPPAACWMLSVVTGCAVSAVAGGYLLKSADGTVKKISQEEAERLVKELQDTDGTADAIEEIIKKGREGGTHVLPNAEDLKMSQTVQNHMNDVIKKGPNAGQLSRPYIDSDGTTLLLKEIMESADSVPDAILQSGLRWDVSGTFRGSTGTWELVVDTSTNTVVHFNFVAQ